MTKIYSQIIKPSKGMKIKEEKNEISQIESICDIVKVEWGISLEEFIEQTGQNF